MSLTRQTQSVSIMEVHSYPTSLGLVKEIVLDDGFEKITLVTERTSKGDPNLLVSNLNLIETKPFLESLDILCFSEETKISFGTEEEFLVFLLSGRWALEKEMLATGAHPDSRLGELLYHINESIEDYLLDPYVGDKGDRH